MSRNLTLTALACLALAACGTPQQQCIARNTDEYRTVSRLLAEVEGNLARGYAWDERVVTRTEFDTCPTVLRNRDGERVLVQRTCWRDVADTERFRVPIDPVVEQRKAQNLRARLDALRPNAERAVQACRAAYPEERR